MTQYFDSGGELVQLCDELRSYLRESSFDL